MMTNRTNLTLTLGLPPELIDHIFSFLQDDTSALKACSKAHPLYSRLAEPYLYAHIVYNPYEPPTMEMCNHFLENPHYPRTLETSTVSSSHPSYPLALSILKMIPRMANLTYFSIYQLIPEDEEYLSALGSCLQQSSFRQLSLNEIYILPLSILDDAKNIKKLVLSNIRYTRIESQPPSSQLSLDTLVLIGEYNQDLHRWAMRWVTRLTKLGVLGRGFKRMIIELLAACSNSLTKLHLDLYDHCIYVIYGLSN